MFLHRSKVRKLPYQSYCPLVAFRQNAGFGRAHASSSRVNEGELRSFLNVQQTADYFLYSNTSSAFYYLLLSNRFLHSTADQSESSFTQTKQQKKKKSFIHKFRCLTFKP